MIYVIIKYNHLSSMQCTINYIDMKFEKIKKIFPIMRINEKPNKLDFLQHI